MESGLLLVNKPEGLTSHDVVGRCRRFLQRKDIGHAGTLDPMATGLLVLLVGKATKLSDFILNGDKAYATTVRLGVETDTDDITGEVIAEKDPSFLDPQDIKEAALSLTGALELPVPIYSAIKVKGKKLYEKARKGEDFKPPMRTMTFDNLVVESVDSDRVQVQFSCTKGAYVRAWGKALGKKLKVGATLEALHRTHSSPYSVTEAMELETLLESDPEDVAACSAWVPLKKTLPGWPVIKVTGYDEKLISNGQIPRKLERFLELEYGGMNPLQGIKVLSRRSGELISLLSHEPPLGFKIRRVFPNQ